MMHDAAAAVGEIEQLDTELLRVDFELPDLACGRVHRDWHAAEHRSVRVGVEGPWWPSDPGVAA